MKRFIFKDIGYFINLRYAHDYDFFLRLCSHYKVHVIETPLLKYRIHGGNTIKENEAVTTFEIGLVLAKFILNYDFNNLFEDEKQRYDAMERLFYSINPNHAKRMIMIILLYMMRCKDNKDQIFKDLTENTDNPIRKACIDSFRNYIDLWQNSQEAWRMWSETNERLIETDKELGKTTEELGKTRDKVSALINSRSYRIGRAFTWPMRKVLGKN